MVIIKNINQQHATPNKLQQIPANQRSSILYRRMIIVFQINISMANISLQAQFIYIFSCHNQQGCVIAYKFV